MPEEALTSFTVSDAYRQFTAGSLKVHCGWFSCVLLYSLVYGSDMRSFWP